ncbi:unnamed protein product [Pieris macdunnoughi]|uniref:Uncharacterized protein n=1 Tax=Pieris macdunnoughi TaxID=345717 RepID=A0A821PJW6_9NEOP|nr:unnamed protein product [Pieris macdunnoughi]
MCYRSLIPVFLSISAALAAPQDFQGSASVAPLPNTTNVTDSNNTLVEEKEIPPLENPVSRDVTQVNLTDSVEFTTEFDQLETTTDLIELTPQQTSTVVPITTTVKTIPRKPSFIKPKPKFVSKLSYFNKASVFDGIATTNLVERTGKRKFKSHCRCEKIWNCPKLQITVPRCPNEYFLCCF